MATKDDGGPAFPESYVGNDAPHTGIGGGMSLRDYYKANSPIDFDMVCRAWGGIPNLTEDRSRVAFFAVWALLNGEYADAMLAERARKDGVS